MDGSERIRPFLSGAVADTVADMLDHPDRPLRQSPMWGG
jgi:hypothetical protein